MPKPMDLQSTLMKRRQHLISELQTYGLDLVDDEVGVASRKGGAGPSDHKAVIVMGTTVMVPVHTRGAHDSPYSVQLQPNGSHSLFRDGAAVGLLRFPPQPRFYGLQTEDGIPYWKIAQLHAGDVLATTVLQTCFRYPDVETRCQFCAIGESLRADRTIAHKTPEQLAEVAEAARRLDQVQHVVLTTGTPPTSDRGARVLRDCSAAIKGRTGLPIQAQCEPPEDFSWFEQLQAAGVDSLGMHLESFDRDVRARIMPSKAQVPVEFYMKAFQAAVRVFGRTQVSTYLLAGLGDSREVLLEGCRKLIDLGVYPFVVPFVPITGTLLEGHSSPTPEFMQSVLGPLGGMLKEAGMTSANIKAGCGKCGACSSLSTFEV